MNMKNYMKKIMEKNIKFSLFFKNYSSILVLIIRSVRKWKWNQTPSEGERKQTERQNRKPDARNSWAFQWQSSNTFRNHLKADPVAKWYNWTKKSFTAPENNRGLFREPEQRTSPWKKSQQIFITFPVFVLSLSSQN